MEEIIVLLSIIILVLVVSFRNRALERISNLEEHIRLLRDQLYRLSQAMETKAAAPKKEEAAPAAAGPQQEPPAAPVAFVKAISVSPVPATEAPSQESPSRESTAPVPPHGQIPTQTPAPGPAPIPAPPPPPDRPGFFERHPDLEKFIGENLISKIGIAILVLAIGFFVKYAIDNDWIGPIGRVGIGLICGGILVGLAHLMRNSYKSFSSILVGGGLAIFYFSISLAFHQYRLFGQLPAFIIMLFITAFAVLLSLLYDRQELAIIALLGGFISPFIASNGSGDYISLFIYLLVLNTGLLVIAYHKAWRLLNLLAFIFTALLFGSWLFTLAETAAFSTYRNGFLYATLFYILFFAINIAHTVRENKKFIASDFGILLANTCLYFGGGLYLLTKMDANNYRGLFSASLGIFNLGTSYFLFRQKKVDANILYLLIGITLSFISLTAPIQLHGHYITLFWASESVLLYWLFTKSRIRIIGLSSLLVWGAMLISLLMDWGSVYGSILDLRPYYHKVSRSIVFNKGLMTGLYAALCCYALSFLRRKEEKDRQGIIWVLFLAAGSLLLFTGGALEINLQFKYYFPGSGLNTLYLLLYTFFFVSLLHLFSGRLQWVNVHGYAAGAMAACIIIYLLFIPDTFSIQRRMLEEDHYRGHFIAHWLSALFVGFILYRLITLQRKEKIAIPPAAFTWILSGLIVIFLSAEAQLLVNTFFYSKVYPLEGIQTVYDKAGLPILWGLCSFAFMWLGMRYKFKPLRIVSLVLFSITLLKLFLFDIRDIPVAGKIAAFFCLGVLLLVVSFMYQRLKKIIIEDEANKDAANKII